MKLDRRDVLWVSIICLAGLLCYLPALGQATIWANREVRHAQIAREMMATGDYVVPHLVGEVYSDKPPLFHWLIVLSYRVLGRVDEFSMRLPSALAAVVSGACVFLLGRLLYNRRTGIIAAFLLFGTGLFGQWAGMSRPDMVMSAWLICTALLTALAARSRRASVRWALAAAACLCLFAATFVKGLPPLGIGLIVMGVTWLCLAERRWLAAPLVGLSVVTVATLGWLWLEAAGGNGFIRAFATFQTGQTGLKHVEPLYYYLSRAPVYLLPCSAWAPFAIWWSVKRLCREGDWARAYPALVSVAIFAILSVVNNRRIHYILPAVPFAALMVGNFLSAHMDAHEGEPWFRAVKWPALALLVAAPLVGAGVAIARPGSLSGGFALVLAALVAVTVASAVGIHFGLDGGLRSAVGMVVVAWLLLVGAVWPSTLLYYWLPDDEIALSKEAAANVTPGVPVGLGSSYLRDTIAFCLPGTPVALRTEEDMARFAAGPSEKFIIAQERFLPAIKEAGAARIRVVGRLNDDREERVLMLRVLPGELQSENGSWQALRPTVSAPGSIRHDGPLHSAR